MFFELFAETGAEERGPEWGGSPTKIDLALKELDAQRRRAP